AADLEHARQRRMAQPRQLLELVEQHRGTAHRHDLERAGLAGLAVDDLEHAAERASADRFGDPEPSPDLAVSRFHRLPSSVNLIGTCCQLTWLAAIVPRFARRV